MATLLALFGPRRGVRLEVTRPLLLGRGGHADVQIVDEKVSREHCRFTPGESEGKPTLVEDLGSQNGTFVNGERIAGPVHLQPGDEVAVGDSLFVVDAGLGDDVLVARFGEDAIWVSGRETAEIRAAGTEVAPVAAGVVAPTADHFRVLRAALSALAAATDQESAGRALLAALEAAFVPDHAFVLLAGRDRVVPLVGKSRGAAVPISRALLALAEARAGSGGDGLRLADAGAEPELRGSRSVVRHGTRRVMVTPVRRGDRTIGFLHVDRQGGEEFGAPDLQLLSALAAAAGAHGLGVAGSREGGVAASVPAPAASEGVDDPVGAAPAFRSVLHAARTAGRSDTTILITGETGTGKEEIARLVHRHSPRAAGPFVAVNCGAIPPELVASHLFGHERGAFTGADRTQVGVVEAATGGTLFLDEIGELPLLLQVQLLRVLQERAFSRVGATSARRMDARVVAATHRDLAADVTAGRFRQDLFFRLNVVDVRLPPLRERGEDLPALADALSLRIARRLGRPLPAWTPGALGALRRWPWPGNVRELANVIERIAVLREPGETAPVSADDVHAALGREVPAGEGGGTASGDGSLAGKVAAVERTEIERALRQARGVKLQAARALGISRPTLDKKIAEHGIDLWKE